MDFNSIVLNIFQNLNFYIETSNTIFKSLYFHQQGKQMCYLFTASTGAYKVYNTSQLRNFFSSAMSNLPPSIYSDAVDQEIYTIFLCRDFFASLLVATQFNQQYFAQGKYFCYEVILPVLLYPTASPRSQIYTDNQLLDLYNQSFY
jgi:hypothetical protein